MANQSMIQALRESFDIPKNWSKEQSVERIQTAPAGTFILPDELLAAYVYLNRNEFSRFCTQIGRTTKEAKNLLTGTYGWAWEFVKVHKPKQKPEPKRNKPSRKLLSTVDWLLKYFREHGQKQRYVLAAKCIYDACQAGIKRRTLERAKDYLEVYCFQAHKCWWWRLE